MNRIGTGWLSATIGIALGAMMLAAAPAWAAKDRFVVDLVNEPSSLDPQLQWNPDSYYVYRNIFDNLVTRDDQGKIAPEVATSWKYVSDTEIEFQIRDDITFHDGSKLTAEDVAYSVRRITDPKLASPQLGQFNKITGAEATGPTTVRLKTDGPYPALLAQLVKLSIVPKHVVEAVGNEAFNLAPVGSGPYKVEGWQRGVAVTLARNDAYWGTKGPFATAVFRAVPDAATRLADLQAGTADLAVTLDSDLAAQLTGSDKAKPLVVLTERVAYFRLNTLKPPFDNPKLRQAVAYAIDKQGLTEGILGGYDKPVAELLTPAHFGWTDGVEGYAYDLDKAKALVTEAGPAAKTEVELATAPVFDQRIVQALQQQLADAGFDVKISMSDATTSSPKRIAGGQFGGRAEPELRPLVLRLPGCRRRAVPAAAQQQRPDRLSQHDVDKLLVELLDPTRRTARLDPLRPGSTRSSRPRCRCCRWPGRPSSTAHDPRPLMASAEDRPVPANRVSWAGSP